LTNTNGLTHNSNVTLSHKTRERKSSKESQFLRARDVVRQGTPREVLRRLVTAGKLQRVGRGIYVRADAPPSEHRTLVEASLIVPNGVICLLSALRFHQLTTQAPFEVWMAIDVKAWRPRIGEAPIHLVRFSGNALTMGVEQHTVEGVPMKVYGVAKTVADCFKYRNKIGIDVAIEALREAVRNRKATLAEIEKYAAVCRVSNVMRPYLEMLTT
jgi:predicted transcriptional regulator of viral defense system